MNMPISYDDWFRGNALLLGRAVMAPLTPDERVARAVAILDLCRSRWPRVEEVQFVLHVGASRDRWQEGHDAFDAVRLLTLEEERNRTNDVYRALLYVAESAAKIIYNASDRPAPFDRDSPYWLSPNARSFVEALGDRSFGLLVWTALRSHLSALGMQSLPFPDLPSLLDGKHAYIKAFEKTLDDLQPGLARNLGAVLDAPPEVGRRALSYVLTLACEAQNSLNFALGRAAVLAMPRAWVLANIDESIDAILAPDDEWPWRRSLELAWKLDIDLVGRLARMGLFAADAEIRSLCEEALAALHPPAS